MVLGHEFMQLKNVVEVFLTAQQIPQDLSVAPRTEAFPTEKTVQEFPCPVKSESGVIPVGVRQFREILSAGTVTFKGNATGSGNTAADGEAGTGFGGDFQVEDEVRKAVGVFKEEKVRFLFGKKTEVQKPAQSGFSQIVGVFALIFRQTDGGKDGVESVSEIDRRKYFRPVAVESG